MITHHLAVDLAFESRNGVTTDDDFDTFTDRFIDELDNLQECDPGIIDPDVVGSLTQRSLSVTMGVRAHSLEDAIRLFSVNVRAALHAAECGTPTWPHFVPTTQSPEVRPVDAAIG
ncbi:hypothetical protein [Nocardiopsis listeri]|uniref:hypothetical protein n=1 Tax=Nocardiopsis listeri TaxID=53440 RepID=UPI0008359AE4|nr:hypothetical protein [Nocardiopsis listeri]